MNIRVREFEGNRRSAERFNRSIFEDELAECHAVSFDIFDTVFIRLVSDPEDVFDLVGEIHRLFDFRSARKLAQQEAFRIMTKEGRREITLADIYACLRPVGASPAELMATEIRVELAVLQPNPEMLNLMAIARSAGRRVVLTSDMYLPSDMIAELCARHGVVYDALFLSCERQATKRDFGALFRTLAAELKAPPERILHIGDNAVSDVERGREQGLRCLFYEPEHLQHAPRTSEVYSSIVQGVGRAQTFQTERSIWWRYGFAYGAPATYAVLLWLDQCATSDKLDLMLFLARDGLVLETLWRAGVGRSIDSIDRARSVYFLGTRTSLALAAIDELNFDASLDFLLSGGEGLEIRDLFNRLGVEAPSEHVLSDLGLSSPTVLEDRNRTVIIALLQAFRGSILQVCYACRRGFHGYLQQLGLQDGSRVGVVDVGWSGSTQTALSDALAPFVDVELVGYYLCLQDNPIVSERRRTTTMKALLSAETDKRSTRALYDNRVAVELFFSAPHGSVIGYRGGGGSIEVVEDPGRDADPRIAEVAGEINAGIEAGVRELDRLTRELELEPHLPSLLEPLIRLAARPTTAEAAQLGSLYNFDAWGASSAFRRHVAEVDATLGARADAWPAGTAALRSAA